MGELYEFITINRNKRKGPFLVRRLGVPIAFGYRTKRDAEAAVARSEREHARWVRPFAPRSKPKSRVKSDT